jgi:hypothetical protein
MVVLKLSSGLAPHMHHMVWCREVRPDISGAVLTRKIVANLLACSCTKPHDFGTYAAWRGV